MWGRPTPRLGAQPLRTLLDWFPISIGVMLGHLGTGVPYAEFRGCASKNPTKIGYHKTVIGGLCETFCGVVCRSASF